jgi:hypothetical protein
MSLGAVNRRGRSITCEITVLPLLPGSDGAPAHGAIILMRDLPAGEDGADGAG